MSYFRTTRADDEMSERLVNMAEELVAKHEELVAKIEHIGDGRPGAPAADWSRRELPEARKRLEDARRGLGERLQEREAKAAEAQAALSEIGDRALLDAQSAWRAGSDFFAPVLFQQVARDGAGWEVLLYDISAIGWRLHSWQVIGPAPAPFEARVTLLQTLFVR